MDTTWKTTVEEALIEAADRVTLDMAKAEPHELEALGKRLASIKFLSGYVDYLALADTASAVDQLQTPLRCRDSAALPAYDVVVTAARKFFSEPETQAWPRRIAETTSAALDTLADEFEDMTDVVEFRRIYEQALIAAVVSRDEDLFFRIVRLPVVGIPAAERVLDAVERVTRQSFYNYGVAGRGAFRLPTL